jgi:glutamate carboxypeptidase
MANFAPTLEWIDAQAGRMREMVEEFAGINSNARNLEGLGRLTEALKPYLGKLDSDVESVPLGAEQIIDSRGREVSYPLAPAIRLRKRTSAPLQVFLNIHIDTVYPKEDAFQRVEQVDADTLRGPGVIDAKGGLVVLMTALEAVERSFLAQNMGWELFLNTDEEIGSPGSSGYFAEAAKRHQLGLLFEPAMPDGALVAERKGSGNFSLVVRGWAAHAGRDFAAGRNAVVAASDFALDAHRLNGTINDATLNVARIEGGGPANVVPDLAICRLNARVSRREDQGKISSELARLANEVARRHDVTTQLHGHFSSPPKQLDARTRALAGYIEACGKGLNIPITWRSSGGASDGNKLAAAGLPVVDTLGPVGADLHSPNEHLVLSSLAQRAKLAALVLLKLATGALSWPPA